MLQWQKEWLVVRKVYSRMVRKANEMNGYAELKQDMGHLLDYVSNNQEQMRQMQMLVNTLAREYANDTTQASLVIDALEQEVKQVRMLPLSTITGSFGRMVRDLAQNANKEAVLHIVGSEVELDKRVLEQIKDPLIHLLRNAIDHGLEDPATRERLGKPRVGTLTLLAEQSGKEIVIRISDDGGGLDIEAIREVARRKDDIGAEADMLSEAELVELIFNPRFSTSPIITDVSGRGVGLDVVRRNVGGLGGRIDVDWTHNVGSTFSLILPLTLTSTRGLLVRASKQLFAIPFSAIERILRIAPDEVSSLGGHETIHHHNRPYPLVRLSDILELPRIADSSIDEEDAHLIVVIVATAERRMAFVVDRLVGEQEMVIKGMGQQLRHVGGIAGATVMGNGEVLLVLNIADLIKLALRSESRLGERRSIYTDAMTDGSSDDTPQHRILVVDDSVTTRTLEKNVLEAAGYEVQLAVNGQEALGIITTGDLPDLVISDVVMPRLDGFGLTERIKNDARTAEIPVILVTSLDSTEDKTRGIEVGADAYIVKSHFVQNNLLETIEQLI
jgi:two-component system chemotaxis sensor kinase CheA